MHVRSSWPWPFLTYRYKWTPDPPPDPKPKTDLFKVSKSLLKGNTETYIIDQPMKLQPTSVRVLFGGKTALRFAAGFHSFAQP